MFYSAAWRMASDLEQLCSYVNEKIDNIKKILSIRNLGKQNQLTALGNTQCILIIVLS